MYKLMNSLNMPKKPALKDWHRADIIAAVRKTGTDLSKLSVKHGLGIGVLRNCLNHPYPKYERIIAEHLGIAQQTIWPSRYHEDGSPKSGRGERGLGRYKPKNNSSANRRSRNVYLTYKQGL
jgi:Ner family transcriptional regulator